MSWSALTQSFDVAVILDREGGVVVNADGTRLMDLRCDENGIVFVQEVFRNELRSAPQPKTERFEVSHESLFITKDDVRPDLLSSSGSDNEWAEASPPPSPQRSPPPLEKVDPDEEKTIPPLERVDDRWCAFDTAAAMSMTSDQGRIRPGTRHPVDIDIVPYGAGATRVREAGTMLVQSRGKEILLTNTLLTDRGPTIMAWGPLAQKGCTCLLGGAGGALYDSKGMIFATMHIHARANILVLDEGGRTPVQHFPISIEPRTVKCAAFTVLSSNGIFHGGDPLADRLLSRRMEGAAFAVPGATKTVSPQGARRRVSFEDTQSKEDAGRARRDILDVEEEEAQPAAVDHGHEKKILRLSKKALELAHLRLGHASRQRIVQLARSGALTGFSLQTISHEPLEESACESCLAGNWPKGPLDPGGLSGREALLRGPSSAKRGGASCGMRPLRPNQLRDH